MKIKVKTTKDTIEVDVDETVTIKELKKRVGELVSEPEESKICLIFSGKILKDDETVSQHGIKDGFSIHMVIRNKPPPAAPSSDPPSQQQVGEEIANLTTTEPTNQTQPPPLRENPLFAGAGTGMQENLANQMLRNPEMMRQMMNSPLMQNILGNEEFMRNMITRNPQMRQLVERNPELGHLLNDPEVLRQTMEVMRNPNMLQEMIRNHDRALNNLEGIPGGAAALQRFYQDYQEPLLDSARSGFGTSNPFAGLIQNNRDAQQQGGETGGAGAGENRDALPNPWGGRPTANPRAASETSAGNGNTQQTATTPHQQQNQDFSQNLFASLGQNAPAQTQELMQALANPRVIQALNQIEQGRRILQQEAPQLFTLMMGMSGLGAMPNTPSGQQQQQTTGNGDQNAALNALMQQMILGNMGGENTNTTTRPEERYREQLEQLLAMGFTDSEANLRALVACGGNVSAAIEHLINRR